MACRVRSSPNHVFDVFMEISRPGNSSDSKPYILQQYPHNFKDEEITKSVPQFCYPCRIDSPNVLHFSFVLTSIDSKWSFGFIRHPPQPGDTCLLLLSSLPWHDTFYKLLNYIASLIAKDDTAHLNRFLEALYLTPVPQPGLYLQVIYAVNNREYEFTAQCPDHHKIPSIPEDRNLSEYFNAVDSNNMITIFASMLNERRIIITSKKLSRLSACVQAANDLIYPMYWQHIFIPVLPSHLLDYLSAPMPFLIGVPSSILATVKHSEFGEIVILDADENKITTPFDDVGMLPNEIVSFLKKSMKNSGSLIGDGVARTFLKALVMLIGGYQNALRFPSGSKITFDKETFVRTRPDHMQPFLQKMLHLQIFHQFIEDRIRMLTNAESISDEFEFEVNMYEEEQSSHRFRTQYKEWLGQMKKEGGALLKSVNPAVKSAYKQVKSRGKQVKDKSKKAYHGFRLKLQDINRPGEPGLPRSAPSTPRESPTSSAYYGLSEEPSNGSVRKSVSGLALAKQGRHQIVSTPSVSDFISKKTFYGDLNLRRDPFSKDTNYSLEQAPEASSEDSEIDSVEDEKLAGIEGLTYKPINLDLMGELQEVIKGFGLKSPLDYSSTGLITNINNNNQSDWVDLQSQESKPIVSSSSSNSQSRRASYNLPLPPPSKSTNSSRKSSDNPVESKENLLITLDSSPEDIEAIFDPLLQKKQLIQQQKQLKESTLNTNLFDNNVNSTKQLSSSASSSIQSGLNVFTGTSTTTTTTTNNNSNYFLNQQRPQLPPKPPAQSSLYRLPATTRYNNNHLSQPHQHSSSSSSAQPYLPPSSSLSSNSSSSTSSSPYSYTSSSSSSSSVTLTPTGHHQQYTRASTINSRPDNVNNLIGNNSFLHSFNQQNYNINNNHPNGALRPIRSNAYTNPICNVSNPNLTNTSSNSTTGLSSTHNSNPFTTPITYTNNHPIITAPVHHHQFTSCGKSSTSVVNSMIHPKCETIINSDQNAFNSNWQKFE